MWAGVMSFKTFWRCGDSSRLFGHRRKRYRALNCLSGARFTKAGGGGPPFRNPILREERTLSVGASEMDLPSCRGPAKIFGSRQRPFLPGLRALEFALNY